MPKYQLKANQSDFEVVDGPLAGRKFQAGQVYTEIPEVDQGRFEKIQSNQPEVTREITASPKKNKINKPGFGVWGG